MLVYIALLPGLIGILFFLASFHGNFLNKLNYLPKIHPLLPDVDIRIVIHIINSLFIFFYITILFTIIYLLGVPIYGFN